MTTSKDQKDYALSSISKQDDIEEGQISSLDEAELFLHEHGISHVQLQELLNDEAKSKKLRRRIDCILLPLLCGTYVLQYIDKQALSYSAVFDLFTDANINSDQYSWLASIFYFGYLFWEYPASYIAQRLPIGTVISTFVLCWGSILMITASSHNFAGMGICRFLLGCFEAPITPCFMMIVGMWYLRQEQPFRAGCFYCCNGVGSMTGGLITYGIGQINSFPVWKAVFLICGGATVIWGGFLMFLLPNDILSAKRFTVEEKILLIGRGKRNQTGILNRSIKWYQIREALVDPQVWILFVFTLLNETINGGFANFGKLIIKGIVSSPLETTALGIPQGAFQVFFILTGSYLSSRFKNIRTIIMAVYLLPTVIGVCLLWKFPRGNNQYGVLFGYYITGSFVSSLVLALQMPASNMGGYTKRVTATALVFLAYCVGNIIGPHAFLSAEAPVYETGCKLIFACALCQIVCAVVLRVLLVRRNKRKDNVDVDVGVLADITDFEKIFSKHLSQLGCVYIPIWNGCQVLDYLANPSNPRPDVIFIKFSMPVMSGLETINILRTQPPFSTDPVLRAIPIIGTSPLTFQTDRERYMSKYPMDDMMRRPAKLVDLRRVLLRWSRREFVPGGGFRPVWGPFPLRKYKGPRSLL